MSAYLPKIFTTYNNRSATPAAHEARKVLSHKAFRASFTLSASQYIGPADAAPGRHLPLGQRLALVEPIPQGDDHGLPGVQTLFDAPAHPYTGILGVQLLQHIVIHTDGIHEGKGVAVSVAVDGVGQ